MQYLLDTVAVIRHFSSKGRIGGLAATILEQFERSNQVKLLLVTKFYLVMPIRQALLDRQTLPSRVW